MFPGMREWLVLMAHPIVTIMKVAAPNGLRAVVAESLLLKQQLLILNRSRKKAPNLTASDRLLLGLGALLVSPRRILRVAVAIRPTTLLRFHRALVKRKYRLLFSGNKHRNPWDPSMYFSRTTMQWSTTTLTRCSASNAATTNATLGYRSCRPIPHWITCAVHPGSAT
jgi:hypothetical protein